MNIWKHSIPQIFERPFPIPLPRGAEVLSVQLQRGELVLWEMHAVAVEKSEQDARLFFVVGTGTQVDIPLHTFLGTVQLFSGSDPFVLHVFEVFKQ